jgi:hypothetical protein
MGGALSAESWKDQGLLHPTIEIRSSPRFEICITIRSSGERRGGTESHLSALSNLIQTLEKPRGRICPGAIRVANGAECG